jgi:hypothetical protein
MNEWIELIVIVVIAVCVFTAIYKVVPFKVWKGNKPKFVLFPKYTAKFETSVEAIESALLNLGFSKSASGQFSRGKVYGDFSAKSIKLSVTIDTPTNQIKVCASFFGILFDTGDIWQVTSDIVNNEKH